MFPRQSNQSLTEYRILTKIHRSCGPNRYRWNRLICNFIGLLMHKYGFDVLRNNHLQVPDIDNYFYWMVLNNKRHYKKWEPVLLRMTGDWISGAKQYDNKRFFSPALFNSK